MPSPLLRPPYCNGSSDNLLRPRLVKRSNQNQQTSSEDGGLISDAESHSVTSTVDSGRSTPLPPDAPPSYQSIASARKQLRAEQRHRIFPTISYEARVSHFDPKSDYGNFRGFFVLFWIALAIMVITTMLRNLKDTGYPVRNTIWVILAENVPSLGLSDFAMVASTVVSLPLQKLCRSSTGFLSWDKGGMAIFAVYEFSWFMFWIYLPFMLGWTWTAHVFMTLHTLVFLMKMHSYGFYNGHLSVTEKRLRALDQPETASTEAAVKYPTSHNKLHGPGVDNISIRADSEIEEKTPMKEASQTLSELRSDLAYELTSTLGHVSYPQNLTLLNYMDYIFCPTLCYELEYPRVPKIRLSEVFFKVLAIFGCIFLLTLVSEEFIVPPLHEAEGRLQNGHNFSEKSLAFAETVSMLLFPFMVSFLLVFLVIFEYVLGACAEMTRFADRHFYSDWWNSSDWLEFSREWNIPVHHFLRRHVFLASRPRFSRSLSTVITFLISALAHELVMGCITKKLRGYGFFAMMFQIPYVAFQKSRFMRNHKLLNNVFFWISMILGLSLMCSLYVLI